jgi:hypothetical protein
MNLTQLQQSNEYVEQISRMVATITLYGTVFIAFPGLVMNAFNIYIFNRNRAFTRSVRFFYTFQSLGDMSNLLFCVVVFFPLTFAADVGALSDPICKISMILRRYASALAAWSQTILSFDRVLSIVFSVKYKSIEGIKYRWSCAAFTVIGLLMVNLINSYYERIETKTTTSTSTTLGGNVTITHKCTTPRSVGFLANMMTTLTRTIMPFALMITFNMMLIYSLRTRKRKMSQQWRNNQNNNNRKEFNFAVPIIALNSLFLLINTPLMLYQLSEFLLNVDSDEHKARMNLYRIVGHYFNFAYSAMAFLFNTALNKLFRRELCSFLFGNN